jgi:beta-aspartyl-peptidase (threonine type)
LRSVLRIGSPISSGVELKEKRVILVHGGAWAVPADEIEHHREGVRRAAIVGWDVLSRGGSALDAVAGAVRLMESNPNLNAGRGSVLNQKGEIELDAAIMDGRTLAAGAVASVQGIENPIDVARKVMECTPHVMLVGRSAEDFAREHRILFCDPSDLIEPHERARWEAAKKTESSPQPCDTVGAVAFDGEGHVAAATSTGGSLLKIPGRVGDSPIIGAGLYADDELGAASSTGWGEGSIRIAMAFRAVSLIAAKGSAVEAAREVVSILKARTDGHGGVILVDPEGNPGYFFNTPHMAHAYLREGMTEPDVGI